MILPVQNVIQVIEFLQISLSDDAKQIDKLYESQKKQISKKLCKKKLQRTKWNIKVLGEKANKQPFKGS